MGGIKGVNGEFSWNSFTRVHATINYSSGNIQGATIMCFLLVCRTRVAALTVVYFTAPKSGLISPGEFMAPPWTLSFVSPPHTSAFCLGKGPLPSPYFCRLAWGLAWEPLERLFSIIY